MAIHDPDRIPSTDQAEHLSRLLTVFAQISDCFPLPPATMASLHFAIFLRSLQDGAETDLPTVLADLRLTRDRLTYLLDATSPENLDQRITDCADVLNGKPQAQ